jgi:hypothetical protein
MPSVRGASPDCVRRHLPILLLLLVSPFLCAQTPPTSPHDTIRRQAELSKVQAKIDKHTQAYWEDWFWTRDFNRFADLMNQYTKERRQGKIKSDLWRKIQKHFHKLGIDPRFCKDKPRKQRGR